MLVLLAEEPIEHIEARGPEALVEAQPFVRGLERSRIEAAHVGAPAHLARISPAPSRTLMCFEAAASEMAKGSRELAHSSLPGGKLEKHPPAGRIAQRMKDGTELGASKFNHVVECTRRFLKVNRLVE